MTRVPEALQPCYVHPRLVVDGAAQVEFRILGPVEGFIDGRPLALAGAKQRALLAILLVRANEVVSIDSLIDELWGEEPPATARKSVQMHISRLRREIERAGGNGSSAAIVTRPPGYVLRLEGDELDLHRFERLVEQARGAREAEDAEASAALLREALGLWRGIPLADVAYEPFAQREIARLEEARLAALEDHIDACLTLGRHAALVPELETLVTENPLRERLRAQLMLALYRSGRQAEALASYREARRALVGGLGIEPSQELQRLERAMLRQDASLDLPPPPTLRGDDDIVERRPRRRLRTAAAAAAALVFSAAFAAGLVVAVRDGGEPRRGERAGTPVPVKPNSVAIIDPETNEVVASIPVGATPGPIAVGEGSVWVANVRERTVSRIDPKTRTVDRTIGLGIEPTGLAVGEGAVWVAGGFDRALWRIDTADNVVRAKLRIGQRVGPARLGYDRGPSAVAVGEGAVWLAHGEEVSRIDPTTNAVVATIGAGGSWTSAIAAGEGSVWVAENDRKIGPRRKVGRGVSQIDPHSNLLVRTISTVSPPVALAVGEGAVWAAAQFEDIVLQIDPAVDLAFAAKSVPAGDEPISLAVADGAVWVANEDVGALSRIDAYKMDLLGTVDIGERVAGVAVGEGAVWVSVR